jgi:hypothetical protein
MNRLTVESQRNWGFDFQMIYSFFFHFHVDSGIEIETHSILLARGYVPWE